jgi:hypothetical protein
VTLPLAQQLSMLLEDYEHDRVERAVGHSGLHHTYPISDLKPLFDRMHKIAVKNLQGSDP